MQDIVVVIAAHKPCQIPNDDLYLPLQVGRDGKDSIGFQGDDTGDNISYKNSTWCELTGIYWAWKNLSSDYIGLVHYRRLFQGKRKGKPLQRVLTKEEAKEILNGTDIILPKCRNYRIMTLQEHFNSYDFTVDSDIENLKKAIMTNSPEYMDAFLRVMGRKKGHMFNMFIMRTTLLNEYCSWAFPILEKFETYIGADRGRLVGYAAEHLLDVWIEKKQYKYYECNVVMLDRKNDIYRKIDFLCRKLGIRHRFIKV